MIFDIPTRTEGTLSSFDNPSPTSTCQISAKTSILSPQSVAETNYRSVFGPDNFLFSHLTTDNNFTFVACFGGPKVKPLVHVGLDNDQVSCKYKTRGLVNKSLK
ncbi:hypothetical protein CDAR_563941 [Caerostris darwini]|uniref:Uncharacterized protein n=1 Tax=Caerostris darwini TaxID=1538125 RepID=A0AAV4V067_9ARAC|nr:hypothetical protein CDAR_563941 [Caerostris darwini]